MAFTPVVARDGNNAAQSMAAFQDLASVNYAGVSLDSTRQTYRAAAIFTPFATAPTTYVSLVGSATRTVRIQRVGCWMVATANASIALQLARGTALGTGGTAVSPTISKLDSLSATATAVIKHYTTAAQTAATGSTAISSANVTGNLVAETVQIFAPPSLTVLYPESSVGGQSIVLRGTSEIFEIQIGNNAATPLGQSAGANGPPAMQMGYFIEWVEDAS